MNKKAVREKLIEALALRMHLAEERATGRLGYCTKPEEWRTKYQGGDRNMGDVHCNSFKLAVDETVATVIAIVEEGAAYCDSAGHRLCRDCKRMVGGSDTPAEWQCDRRIDAATGRFVLCVDERKGTAIGYPLEGEAPSTWACAPIGRHWEAS